MTDASMSLRAFPLPGRLALRGLLPAADAAMLATAGRQALGELRRAALAGRRGRCRRWLAWRRGPSGRGLPDLARHAADLASPGWQAAALVVSLTIENAGGDSASLAWRRDGALETLRWSCRGGAMREDGACQGSASVAAALAR